MPTKIPEPPKLSRFVGGSRALHFKSALRSIGEHASTLEHKSSYEQKRALSKLKDKMGDEFRHVVDPRLRHLTPGQIMKRFSTEEHKAEAAARAAEEARGKANILRLKAIREQDAGGARTSALRGTREVTSAIAESARAARTTAIRTEKAETSALRKPVESPKPVVKKAPPSVSSMVGF